MKIIVYDNELAHVVKDLPLADHGSFINPWLIERPTIWLKDLPLDWKTYHLIERPTTWLTDLPFDWKSYRFLTWLKVL